MVDVVVPSDDGAIQQALAELDERLSTWSAAMREATDALRTALEAAPQPVAATVAPEPEPAAPAATAAVADAAVEATEPAETAPENEPKQQAAEAPAASPPQPPKQKAGIRVLVPLEPEPEPAAEKPSTADDDDEAVLASVDEKTAQALRVMRRLSPVKKSFRQLLEEYQREQENRKEPEPQQTKSWWRRK